MNVFLTKLFQTIKQLDYAVLRNGRDLPDCMGRDIDLYVNENHFSKLNNLISNLILKSENANCVKIQSRYAFNKYYIKIDNQEKYLTIDIWNTIHWYSCEYFSAENLLKNRELLDSGIYHLNPLSELYIKLVKGITQNKNLKDKYLEEYLNLSDDGKIEISNIFKDELGISFKAESSNDFLSQNYKKRIRKHLLTKQILKLQFLNFFKFIFGWLRQLSNSTGKFIVFIGPDGSGKSSLIKSTIESDLPFTSLIYKYCRFGLIPRLSGKKKQVIDRTNVNAQVNRLSVANSSMPGKKLNIFHVLILLGYYGIELILGFPWLWIKKGLGDLVIMDRYIYDYYLLKEYTSVPNVFLKYYFYLAPLPDIIFLPMANPDNIRKRKPELDKHEIERQQKLMLELSSYFKSKCIIIDTNQDLSGSVLDVRKKILEL